MKTTMSPNTPLPRGQKISGTGRSYFYRYTTSPTTHYLSDITEHTAIVVALSKIDADCLLTKKIRKTGRYLHAVLASYRCDRQQ